MCNVRMFLSFVEIMLVLHAVLNENKVLLIHGTQIK